jgi:hypothetical protein
MFHNTRRLSVAIIVMTCAVVLALDMLLPIVIRAQNASALPDCQNSIMGIDRITAESPTTFKLVPQYGTVYEIIEDGSRKSTGSQNGTSTRFYLHDGPTWTYKEISSNSSVCSSTEQCACAIKANAFLPSLANINEWASLLYHPQLGGVPSKSVTDLLDLKSFDGHHEAVYELYLQEINNQRFDRRRRIVDCPTNSERINWQYGQKDDLPVLKPSLVYLKVSDNQCFILAETVRDEREIKMEVGALQSDRAVAALTDPLTTVEFEGASSKCTYELRDNNGNTSLSDCNTSFEINAARGARIQAPSLPTLTFIREQIIYTVRALGTLDYEECPKLLKGISNNEEYNTMKGKIKLCVYQTTVQGDKKVKDGVLLDDKIPSEGNALKDVRFSVRCSDKEGEKSKFNTVILLPKKNDENSNDITSYRECKIYVSKANDARYLFEQSQFDLNVSSIDVGGKFDVTDYPIFVDEGKIWKITTPTNAQKDLSQLLCIDMTDSSPDVTNAPGSYIQVKIDNNNTMGVEKWVQNNRKLCPAFTGDSLVRQQEIPNRLLTGQQIRIQYNHPEGREIYTKTISSSVRASNIFIRNKEEPTERIEGYSLFQQALPGSGYQLCVETRDYGDTITFDASQIALYDEYGREPLIKFSSQSPNNGTIFNGDRVVQGTEARIRTRLYCAPLISIKPGDNSVQFVQTREFDGTEGTLQFRIADITPDKETSSLEPQYGYYVFPPESLRMSSLAFGGWSTILRYPNMKEAAVRVQAMLPAFEAGAGIPSVFMVAFQTGVSVPLTIISTATTNENKADDSKKESTIASVGLGGYAGGCINAQIDMRPKICAGLTADGNLGIRQNKNGKQNVAPGFFAVGYFFSVGSEF